MIGGREYTNDCLSNDLQRGHFPRLSYYFRLEKAWQLPRIEAASSA